MTINQIWIPARRLAYEVCQSYHRVLIAREKKKPKAPEGESRRSGSLFEVLWDYRNFFPFEREIPVIFAEVAGLLVVRAIRKPL